MEKAVESLEIMFQKAEADIEYLSRKLDFQLQSEDSLKDENNPIRLLKKIEEVKSEFSSIANDMSEIQKAQKEATDYFRSQLLTLTQMLEKLGGLVGETPDLEDTTLAQFEELSQLLGVSKSSLLPASYHHENSSPQGNEQEETCSSSNAEEPIPVEGKPSDLKIEVISVSAYDKRKSSPEFIEINTDEFMSVSDLVRGRVKLEDLNRTYRLLWQHFKEEGNKALLTQKEMNNMGLRVSGATGEAKLKILRSLKLCEISRAGDVKLT
ncbi:spindle and kinetochore-associated protein 2-like isoform X1 [Biomphalaria pfeifferi]|uniref:Protein FAM33A n=1 Tax=Biomphalaria pfeifferi TaxID=112525 RepID=A0AAD8C9I4_BIOPF|nr:spindle and kinetochore-associated protein 2-like isoform X1 [Biomphalaria pfeifferi]